MPFLNSSPFSHVKTSDIPASADVWGLGVTLYMLLSGLYPFGDGAEVLGNIVRARYGLEHQRWKSVSGDAKRLLGKLLVANPQERITIDQLFQDPWLVGVTVPPVPEGGREVEPQRVPTQIHVVEHLSSQVSREPSNKKAKLETPSPVERRSSVAKETQEQQPVTSQPKSEPDPEPEPMEVHEGGSQKRAKIDAPKLATLKKLKVADLRVKCDELGISSSGTKDQMIARILAQYQ